MCNMEKEFLEPKTLTKSLSESLSVMVMEKVDSLFTHQRQVMCARYQLRNGAFRRLMGTVPVSTFNLFIIS